jgi:type I restriction enzyme S subunit
VTVVDVAIIRPSERGVDPAWLMWAINSGPVRAQIDSMKAGTTRKRISRKNLAAVKLDVPPPAEQARIVAEVERQLSDLRACEQSIEAGLERSAALRRAVLKAAFAGQLVPQDPTDEPASVLLERIRAEREAAPKAKKPRRPRRAAAP